MASMTGWPTDGADGSVSSEARWRAMARLWAPSGVVSGYLGSLAPSLAGGTITVQAGAAWVDGHYCEIAGSSTFTSTVTGLVVVRFTAATNTFELLYRDGATTPTQGTATWELVVARVTASVLYDVRVLVPVGGSAQTQVGHAALTAVAAQIDFPDIPQTFTHLRLVAMLRGDAAFTARTASLRINGDSGANYDTQLLRGSGATASAILTQNETGMRLSMPAASAYTNNYAPITVELPAYRQTGVRRLAVGSNGWSVTVASGGGAAGDHNIDQLFSQWRGAVTAVSRLTLVPQSGNFAVGSTATLYGLM